MRVSLLAALIFASGCGLVLSFVPVIQTIKLTNPQIDPLAALLMAEFAHCAHNPRRFPACRSWRNRAQVQGQVRSFRDKVYTLQLQIGNPTQKFDVLIDTGSQAFLLAAPECGESCDTFPWTKHPRIRFNYTASETFQSNFTEIVLHYGDGGNTTAVGFLGSDSLNIETMLIKSQDMVLAKNLTAQFRITSADGILGLSFPRRRPQVPLSVTENLRDSFSLFSVFLNRSVTEETADAGRIVWGSLDEKNCANDIHYLPILHPEDNSTNIENHWSFDVDEIVINGEPIGEGMGWTGAADTGSAAILGPIDPFENFITRVINATLNDTTGAYEAPCDADFLPFVLVFGGKQFAVLPSQYVLKFPDNPLCYIALGTYRGAPGLPDWIIGQPFLRSYCSIYDMDKAQIGFSSHTE